MTQQNPKRDVRWWTAYVICKYVADSFVFKLLWFLVGHPPITLRWHDKQGRLVQMLKIEWVHAEEDAGDGDARP
jgi:hypothetical protein